MFEALIDAAMKRARENGDFDNLPGEGRPINPTSLTPDPFAKFYGDGVMTPVGALQKRIDILNTQLREAAGAPARQGIQKSIADLET